MIRKVAFVALFSSILVLAGCDFINSLLDPAYPLRGTWVLDHTATSPDQPTYYEFVVKADNTYEIVDFGSVTIEKGDMRNVTSDSFDYTITVQTLYPSLVGTTSYAKWTISGGTLSISFYDNATMSTKWVTFVCTRP